MSIIILKSTISKINEVPFEVSVMEGDYPIAPLVFAENTAIINNYKIRIVVYIPSEVTNPPFFRVENQGNPCKVVTAGGQELMARSFILDYDYSSEIVPLQYTLWDVCIEYGLSKDSESVDYILTHVRDVDPKTSRGTVTTVQEA